MVEEAGFIKIQTEEFSKTHDFATWARRAGLDRQEVQRLNKFFIDAPAKVHDHFEIETFAGEVESFTDKKILICAHRPDKK
jgi:hypothetical protein